MRVSCLLVTLLSLLSCDDPDRYLQNEPEPHQWGTFGEEVYRLVHDSAAASNDPLSQARVASLRARREPLIEAADLTLPPLLYEPARASLAATLDQIDDGTLPRVTRQGAQLLGQLGSDRATLEAALQLRDMPFCATEDEAFELLRHLGLARTDGGEPILVPLAAALLRLAQAHDGRDDLGQPTTAEPQELREVARALSLSLSELDLEPLEGAHSFDSSLLERLVAAAGIPYPTDEGAPVRVVLADERGLPRVAIDPNHGTVYSPYVDADGDGLADVDLEGELVVLGQVDGGTLAIYGETQSHALDGRALAYDGHSLYEYADVRSSGLGVIARGLAQMTAVGDHAELLHRVDGLLSPREQVQDERDGTWYASFPAGRTESLGPAFDATWALIEASRGQPPDRLLAGARELIRAQRGPVRDLLEQALLAADEVAETTQGELGEHNTLLDDLLLEENPPGAVCYGPYDSDFRHSCVEPPGPLGRRLIESGVLRDLLDVLDDPALAGVGEATADLMSHRDDPIRLETTSLRQPLSSAAESAENRSVFQRMLHLVHDTNDAHFSTLLSEVLIDWQIENMALFYLESYCEEGDDLVPDLALMVLGDYFSSTRPGPDEIARFMVVDHSSEFPLWANPRGREGHDLYNYNADTLLALQLTGMNAALRPLVQVFCDHDELLLLANLFSVLHEHYSTLPAYTTEMTARHDFYGVERPAGVRAYEAAIARALTGSNIIGAALEVGAAAGRLTVDGEPVADDLVAFIDHLTDPDAPVLLRVHDDPGRDVIYRFDQLTLMAHPTHLNVLAQRAVEAADAWEAEDVAVRDDLTAILDLLAEHYLEWPGEGALRRDQAEYMVRLAERALPVLDAWAEENLDRGTWDAEMAEARSGVDDLEVQLTDLSLDPLGPTLLDLLLLLVDDPSAGPLLEQLILYFLTPAAEGAEIPGGVRDPFTVLSRLLVALVQTLPDAISLEQLAGFLATVLAPDTSPIATLPGDLALLTGADPSSTALAAGANALAPGVPSDPSHAPPLIVLAEALAELGRREPGPQEPSRPLTADDLSEIARQGVELLDDTDHGLERIYDIVEARARQ